MGSSGGGVGGRSVEPAKVARSHGCHGGFLQEDMEFLCTLCIVFGF